jgi:aerobic-type carbon monoxide dehydrogenase small subunit (CoxS/CutS family)
VILPSQEEIVMETEFGLTVNGAERSVTCEPDTPLLDVLRHDLGLAGPKFGCGMGQAAQCSYCTSGMVVAAVGLLRERPAPAEQEVREAWTATCAAAGRMAGSSARC